MFLLSFLLICRAFADTNLDSDLLPPKVIFHIGQKQHLLTDDQQQGIPGDVWQKSIMGSKTNFGLVPYRRGLYGGKNFDSLEIFGNRYLGSYGGQPKVPWVMEVTISEQCRKPEVVSDLSTDERFRQWLVTNTGYLLEAAKPCIHRDAKGVIDGIVGMQPLAGGAEENLCDEILQKFLSETKTKVVRDSEWDASWYLRDRDCLEKLDARPVKVLEILAAAHWDWKSRQTNQLSLVNGAGTFTFALLVGALKDSDSVDSVLLKRLRERTAASDISWEGNGKPWIEAAGTATIDAYSRCSETANLALYRKVALEFETSLNDKKWKDSEFRKIKVNELIKGWKALCR